MYIFTYGNTGDTEKKSILLSCCRVQQRNPCCQIWSMVMVIVVGFCSQVLF